MRQTSRHLCKFCCGSKACVLAARGDGEHGKLFFFFFVGYFWSESMKNSAVTQLVQREGGESGGGKVSRGCIFK